MKLFNMASRLMDRIEESIESHRIKSMIGTILALAFLLGIFSVELNLRGFFPDFLSKRVPTNHLTIIAQVFTLLLCYEVISLVLSFVHSVSISMGKQIEILSLVLLRDVFKEFSNFSEPIEWVQVKIYLLPMISSAVGAFIIFIILGFYYKLHKSRPITSNADEAKNFIKIKKCISLFLLISFLIIILNEAFQYLKTGQPNKAFEIFFTILIFSDILIILVSMRYSSNYTVTFRNSGFAVATVFMRLALMSPPPFSALMGIGSALFVLGLSFNYMHCTLPDACD